MNIVKILFELFVLYILYKIVFDLIIPVYQTTREVKQKLNEMQRNMNISSQQNQHPSTGPSSRNQEDYIEFEEIK